MKADIFLCGLAAIDEPEFVKTIEGTSESIRKELMDLEQGYCIGNSKPRLHTQESDKYILIDCYCSEDWHYVARIKK